MRYHDQFARNIAENLYEKYKGHDATRDPAQLINEATDFIAALLCLRCAACHDAGAASLLTQENDHAAGH